jgi:DNA-binding response OmpR family regulator
MRLLLVEDDERIAFPIRAELQHQHYVVDVASDGERGLELAQMGEYALIVLDLLLPKMDGVSMCHALRMKGYSGPILMMTARSSTQDKVLGLDAGADDYLVKPFELDELSARIRALLRRGGPQSPPILRWGDMHVDPAKCIASYRGKAISLTPTEYRLLTFFLRHPEQTFSTEVLLQSLWLAEDNPTPDVIKAHIKGMRRKLKDAGLVEDLLETVYGFGYRLKPHR